MAVMSSSDALEVRIRLRREEALVIEMVRLRVAISGCHGRLMRGAVPLSLSPGALGESVPFGIEGSLGDGRLVATPRCPAEEDLSLDLRWVDGVGQ